MPSWLHIGPNQISSLLLLRVSAAFRFTCVVTLLAVCLTLEGDNISPTLTKFPFVFC
ncbi:hypothetical protein P692DRAFT_20838054 [Suillus brevipes Sb2]|nr:hypothetical protein P692DRAFT_20838054 [Suillus brevipes Sb2]